MKNYTRKVDLVSDEDFKNALESATSYSRLLRSLSLGVSSKCISYAKERVNRQGLDDSHFNTKTVTDSGVMILNEDLESRVSTYILRRFLLDSGRPYCCEDCGNTGFWNATALTLEIHHKNSNWRDNRPNNLAFLCPNCHSVYTRSAERVPDDTCIHGKCDCGNNIAFSGSKYCSLSCHGNSRKLFDWSSLDLISMIDVSGMSFYRVGKILNTRSQTVKKWYNKQKSTLAS